MRSYPSGWSKVLAQLGFRRQVRRHKRRALSFGRISRIEQMEPRQMLAMTYYVNTSEDVAIAGAPTVGADGEWSLREALTAAASTPGNDTIEFASSLIGETIELDPYLGQLLVNSDVVIIGPGLDKLTIDAEGGSRVMQVSANVTATIEGLTITGGGGVSEGAGIANYGTLWLRDARVTENHTTITNPFASGGGVYSYEGSIHVINCTIDNNSSLYGGGLRIRTSDTADEIEITGSTIYGNSAYSSTVATGGGGLFIWSASGATNAVVSNTTISGNFAGSTAGVRVGTGPVQFVNCTITNNEALASSFGPQGGGIGVVNSGVLTLHNSIVADNSSAGTYPDIVNWATVDSSSSNNLIGDAGNSGLLSSINSLNANPQISTLGDYGGPTLTHAILPGSLAIDKGDDALSPELDQRGFDRYNDPNVAGANSSDIGAFEHQGAGNLVVTTLADVGVEHGKLSLRQALNLASLLPGSEVITFDPSLFAAGPATIKLGDVTEDGIPDALVPNTSDFTIAGPGAGLLTIDANGGDAALSLSGGTVRDLRIVGANNAGINAWGGDHLAIERTEIVDNQFGIFAFYSGGLSISESTIAENVVGLHLYISQADISNSTISNNDEAGITAYISDGVIRNATITDPVDISYGAFAFHNSIVAGFGGGVSLAVDGTVAPESSYNIFSNALGSFPLTGQGNQLGVANPGLATLDSYGGPTRTHALLPGSLAIDSASDTLAPIKDQRGFSRYNAPAGGTGVADMGAFESQPTLVVTTTSDVVSPFGGLTLRQAIALAARIPGPNVITFDSAMFSAGPATITLSYDGPDADAIPDPLAPSGDMTILGPGADLLTISGGNQTRVLEIYNGFSAAMTTIEGLTITGGNATTGGGIWTWGDVTLRATRITGNTASYRGGGIYFYSFGALNVIDSEISDNQTPGGGGGVFQWQHYDYYSNLKITNSTISGNQAAGGGGVYSYSMHNNAYAQLAVDIRNSTITGNSATWGAGGIQYVSYSGSYYYPADLKTHNSIIAGNTGVAGIADHDGWDFDGSTSNIIGPSGYIEIVSGGNNLVVAPGTDLGLMPLGFYGGPTRTHALRPESPAIDRGSNAYALAYDQRGRVRIADGNLDETFLADVGAYEFSWQPTMFVTTLEDGPDESSGLSLREAIELAGVYDIIGFADSLDGGVIELMGELTVAKSLFITAHTLPHGLKIKAYDPNPTTQDGDGSRHFNISGESNYVVLRGMTLTGGDTWADGGSIKSDRAHLTLDHMTIKDNVAARAGIMYVEVDEETGQPVDSHWVAGVNGGGVYSTGSLIIADSTFTNNSTRWVGRRVGDGPGVTGETVYDVPITNGEVFSGNVYSLGNLTIRGSVFDDRMPHSFAGAPEVYNGEFAVGGIYASANHSATGVVVNVTDTKFYSTRGVAVDSLVPNQMSVEVSDVEFTDPRVARRKWFPSWDSQTPIQLPGPPNGAGVVQDGPITWIEVPISDGEFLDDVDLDALLNPPPRFYVPENPRKFGGGALMINGANATIDNVLAHSAGAGNPGISGLDGNLDIIRLHNSIASITNSTFAGNTQISAIVKAYGSDVTIDHSTFVNNGTHSTSYALGMQIVVDLDMVSSGHIVDSLFFDNYANATIDWGQNYLSGDPLESQQLTIERTIIKGNSNYENGAIRASVPGYLSEFALRPFRLEIIDSTISDNTVSYGKDSYVDGGAGLKAEGALDVFIKRTNISRNRHLGGQGGGIAAVVRSLRIEDSTISENVAGGSGGGIYSGGTDSILLTNVTIVGNLARGQGGGLFIHAGNQLLPHHRDNVTMVNTIVAGNEALGAMFDLGWGPDAPAYSLANDFNSTHDVWFGFVSDAYLREFVYLIQPWDGTQENLSRRSRNNIIGRGPVTSSDPPLPIQHGIDGNLIGLTTFADDRLTPQGDYGGLTQTHALRLGTGANANPAIDAGTALLLTPNFVVSNAETTDLAPAFGLIDASPALSSSDPLSGAAMSEPYERTWRSNVYTGLGAGTAIDRPTLTMKFASLHQLTGMQLWGSTYVANGSSPWAQDDVRKLKIEFSTDGGETFSGAVTWDRNPSGTSTPPMAASIFTIGSVMANAVRITVLQTFGSEYAELREIRFSAAAHTVHDQRGGPFTRAATGAIGGTMAIRDIGAYESPSQITQLAAASNPATPLVISSAGDAVDLILTGANLTLREAVNASNIIVGANVIHLSDSIPNDRIGLSRGELTITDDLTVDGLGTTPTMLDVSTSAPTRDPLQVYWRDTQYFVPLTPLKQLYLPNLGSIHTLGSRVVNVDDGDDSHDMDVYFDDLWITGGAIQGFGGGIRTKENLTLTDVTVADNVTSEYFIEIADTYTASDVTPFYEVFGESDDVRGGGIYAAGAALTLERSAVLRNRAGIGGGGGIFVSNGVLNVSESVVAENELTFDDFTIWTSNRQFTPMRYSGGGIALVEGSAATIVQTTIDRNKAPFEDVDSYYANAHPIVPATLSTIAMSRGGGMLVYDSSATVKESVISNNSAYEGGGVLVVETSDALGTVFNEAELIAINTTVSGNTAHQRGGGIAVGGNFQQTVHELAWTIVQTQSGLRSRQDLEATSWFADGGSLTLQHTTVTDNSVDMADLGATDEGDITVAGDSGGGGVHFAPAADGADSVLVDYSIVARNHGVAYLHRDYDTGLDVLISADPDADSDLIIIIPQGNTTTWSVTHSLLGDVVSSGLRTLADRETALPTLPDANGNNYGGFHYSDTPGVELRRGVLDPVLGPLANNGGLTKTHALLPGSPAINAGDAFFSSETTDQRGGEFSRQIGTNMDIGAYESRTTFATPVLQSLNAVSSISEGANVAAGVDIAHLRVTSPDSPAYSFELTGADAAMFEVHNRTLRLKPAATLDYETNPTLNVSVRVIQGATTSSYLPFAITVTNANDVPRLDLAQTIALTLARDATAETNAGVTLQNLVGGISDDDGNQMTTRGIAITGIDPATLAHGRFEYSMDGGLFWRAVGEVSNDAALLLPADANVRLRFNITSGDVVTLENALRFVAWDRSQGVAFERTAVSQLGTSVSSTATVGLMTELAASASGQQAPAMAVDSSGGTLQVWKSAIGIVAKRFNAAGAPIGLSSSASPGGVTFTIAAGASYQAPEVVALRNGGFAVAWRTSTAVYVAYLDSDGAFESQWFHVATAAVHEVKLAVNSTDDILVAWREGGQFPNPHYGYLEWGSTIFAELLTVESTGLVEKSTDGPIDLASARSLRDTTAARQNSMILTGVAKGEGNSILVTWEGDTDELDDTKPYGREVYLRYLDVAPLPVKYTTSNETATLRMNSVWRGDQKFITTEVHGDDYFVAYADVTDRSVHLGRFNRASGSLQLLDETVIFADGDTNDLISDLDTEAWIASLDIAVDGAGRVGVAWSTITNPTVRVEWRIIDKSTGDWSKIGSFAQTTASVWNSLKLDAGENGEFVLTGAQAASPGPRIVSQRFAVEGAMTITVSPRLGEPVVVNNDSGYQSGSQINPSVAIDAAGNALHVWNGAGPSGTGIYARRFDAHGQPLGASFNIVVGSTAQNPRVGIDGQGNAIVVWQEIVSGQSRIKGRRYVLNGEQFQAGSVWQLTNSTATQSTSDTMPSLAVAEDGSFFIVWQGVKTGEITNAYAQAFNSSGTPLSGSTSPQIMHPASGPSGAERIVGNGSAAYRDGTFYAAYVAVDADSDLYLRRFGSTGAALDSNELIVTWSALPTSVPSGWIEGGELGSVQLAPAADGALSVVWSNTVYGSGYEGDLQGEDYETRLFLRRRSDSGTWTEATELDTAYARYRGDTQYSLLGNSSIFGVSLAADGLGRQGIVWSRSLLTSAGTSYGVRSKWFDAAGSSLGGPFDQAVPAYWSSLQLAASPQGDFKLVATQVNGVNGADVLTQRFALDVIAPPIDVTLESGGVLQLDNAAGVTDQIKLAMLNYGGEHRIMLNGRLTTIRAADVSRIVVSGSESSEIIDLRGLELGAMPLLGGDAITVHAGGGDDVIYGSAGDDSLDGGSGNDNIYGNGGVDVLDGGAGDDTFYVNNKLATSVTIRDANGGADKIDLEGWTDTYGAAIVMGTADSQAINRAASSPTVTLQLPTGNAIESVTKSTPGDLVFWPSGAASSAKPATLQVTILSDTTLDDNPTNGMSLREALLWAKTDAALDAITFADSLFPGVSAQTLSLQNVDFSGGRDQLVIDSAVNISGPLPTVGTLTISGVNDTRIIDVAPEVGAKISRVTISGGNASGDGGAIRTHGNLTLVNVVVANSAANSGVGGGIAAVGATAELRIVDSTITGNNATKGAGISINGANATLDGVTIDSNGFGATASTEGGGLQQAGGSNVSLTNVTISGNKATAGGGIHASGTGNSLNLLSVTIANNQADSGGGLLASSSAGARPVEIHNTIVAGNTLIGSSTANDITADSSLVAASSNNVFNAFSSQTLAGVTGGGNQTGIAPSLLFELDVNSRPWLKDNFGPTKTHRLIEQATANPAVNNANQTLAPAIDQRRYVDSDSSRDVGAYERSGVPDAAAFTAPKFTVPIGNNRNNGDVVTAYQAMPRHRTYTYELVDPDGAFAIDPNTGEITVADSTRLSPQLYLTHLVRIRVTQTNPPDPAIKEGSVLITVDETPDWNDAPIAPAEVLFQVHRNAGLGAHVGVVSAYDPEGTSLSFSMSGGTALSIDPVTGEVTVNDPARLRSEVYRATVSDGVRQTQLNVRVEVVGMTSEASTLPEMDFEISHRKELMFNPLANFANSEGLDYTVEIRSGSGSYTQTFVKGQNPTATMSGSFRLGSLSVPTDAGNALKFTPKANLVSDKKLSAEGAFRYSASEQFTYTIRAKNSATTLLASGEFSVKVTNDLPVFRAQLQSNGDEMPELDVSANLLGGSIAVLPGRLYRLDLSDYFFDADGDEIDIVQLRYDVNPAQGADITNPTRIERPIVNVASPETSFVFERDLIVERSAIGGVASDNVNVYIDATFDELPKFSDGNDSNQVYPDLFRFFVFATDGQVNSANQKVTFTSGFDVKRPALGTSASTGDMNPLIDVYTHLGFDDQGNANAKLVPAQWSIAADSRQPSREGRDLQAIGGALVDLNSGALVQRHALILDASGGQSEIPLPGLIYDSSTADPRPVIQSTIRRQETLDRTKIEGIVATFRWFDHVNRGESASPRVLATQITLDRAAITSLSTSAWGSSRDLAFAFQPQLAPIFSGVYHWEVEFEITLTNADASYREFVGAPVVNGREVLRLTDSGDTVVVVQNKVTNSNFGTQSPTKWDYTPTFGNGWWLEGAPALFIDDFHETAESGTAKNNDRVILYFPGEAPRVFRPGNQMDASDRQSYEPGKFVPIDVATQLVDPREFGSLMSVGGAIAYTSGEGVKYTFERVTGVSAVDSSAPGWRLKTIEAPGAKNPVEFRYETTAPLRLKYIIGSDFDAGTSIGASDPVVRLTYSGSAPNLYLDQITLADGSVVNVAMNTTNPTQTFPNQLNLLNELNSIQHVIANAPDNVRAFDYIGGRMKYDQWGSTLSQATSSAPSRKTTFEYAVSGSLREIKLGSTAGSITTYTVTSAAVAGVIDLAEFYSFEDDDPFTTNSWRRQAGPTSTSERLTAPSFNPQRAATVEMASNLQTLNESSASSGRTWQTKYTLDARGHVTAREDLFKRATSSTPTQLSMERWTYNHLGYVASYEDKHLRTASETAVKGRVTYFTYDFQTPITVGEPDQPADRANVDDATPRYDRDDFRGNVTRIVSPAGVETMEYETDDELLAAVGVLVKAIDVRGTTTEFKYDEQRRKREQRTIRGTKDASNATNGDDHLEIWDYYADAQDAEFGLLKTYISALGLQTTYTYYDASRQVKTVLVKDDGVGDIAEENTLTVFAYDDGATTGHGFVETIKIYRGTSISGSQLLSTTEYEYDAVGQLRIVEVTDARTSSDSELRREEYNYDPDGRRTEVKQFRDVDGGVFNLTKYAYDGRGLMTSMIVGSGATFDALTGSDAIAQETVYEYYSDGSLKSTLLTTESGPVRAADPKTSYFADPTLRLEWTRTNNVATAATYSSAGAISTTPTDMDVEVRRDILGRVVSERNLLNGAHTEYRYEDPRVDSPTRQIEHVRSQVVGTTTADLDDVITALAYDQTGNVVWESNPGAAPVSRVFDEIGYVKSAKVLADHGAEVDFVTNAVGNVLTQTETRLDGAGGASRTVVTTNVYDEHGRLRRVTDNGDGTARTARLDYGFEALGLSGSPLGRTMTTTSREGLASKQWIDAAGQVIKQTGALGSSPGATTRTFDATGNMLSETYTPISGDTTPSRTSEFIYDSLNRLRVTTRHATETSISRTDYYLPGQAVGADWDVISVSNGIVTKAIYDSLGQPIVILESDPGAGFAAADSTHDAPATVYNYAYLVGDRVTAVTTRRTSARGEAAPSTNDETLVTREVINTRGQSLLVAERTSSLGSSDAVGSGGSLFTNTVQDGYVLRQSNHYGSQGQLVLSVDNKGNRTASEFDVASTGTGQLSRVTSANGESIRQVYDSAGNLRQVIDAGGSTTTMAYDDLGRMASRTVRVDGTAAPVDLTEDWDYDHGGNPLSMRHTDRNGYRTIATLDPVARTQTTTVTKDGTNYNYTATSQLNGDGSVKSVVDTLSYGVNVKSASRFDYTYDALGRLASFTQWSSLGDHNTPGVLAAPATRLVFEYDPNGQRRHVDWKVEAIGADWNELNDAQRASATFTQVARMSYSLDALGRIVGLAQIFDTAGATRWASGVKPVDRSVGYTLTGTGQVAAIRRYSISNPTTGTTPIATSAVKYHDDGRIEQIKHAQDATVLSQFDYSYDGNGRLTQLDSTRNAALGGLDPNLAFLRDMLAYDGYGQLTHSQLFTGLDSSSQLTPFDADLYGFDTAGNRIWSTGDELAVSNQTDNGLDNRLNADGRYAYVYDDAGRLLSRTALDLSSKDEYTWDHRGLLLSATRKEKASGATEPQVVTRVAEYSYDALGHRAGRRIQESASVGGVLVLKEETITHYDGLNRIAEFDASDKIVRHYFAGLGANEVLAIDQSSAGVGATTETAWAFANHLGSVAAWGKFNGTTWTLQHQTYDSFGNLDVTLSTPSGSALVVAGKALPQIWAGHQYEASTGLYYMHARWYDAKTGKFLSQDPIGFEAGDGNLYRYVEGKVTTLTDPDGLNPNQLGAKDIDELIGIVKKLEEDYRTKHGKYPTWQKTLEIFKDLMLEHRDAGSNHYYVFSNLDSRWIDVRHFSEAAIGSAMNNIGPTAAVAAGELIEWGQVGVGGVFSKDRLASNIGSNLSGQAASANGVEDRYSNKLGAAFGQELQKLEEAGNCFLLSSKLEEEFKRLKVDKKRDAASYHYLPENEEMWQVWRLRPKPHPRGWKFYEWQGAIVRWGKPMGPLSISAAE